ncbi:DUF6270 domain-containing protein [Ancylobacter sp. WKF20]|uniref:DUF6270 domain-containing protein n=1 Tax=Ancylobacter sp. WKF20 TaxID=3039801 RepID=UPI0024345C9B|nr:DUF6270 domain-containing protein [Ancylobacter sp. WKF20]WGD28421.1 DUF6270 domain-containing protein [Ancylobacter sp. WKF20]
MSDRRRVILGSCVTRDAWKLPELGCVPPTLYLGRTSLASASLPAGAANPLAALVERITPGVPGKTFTVRSLTAELGKTTVAQIAAARPDVLYLDFIDERFDLLACGAALVTESLELIDSGVMHLPPLAQARRVPRLSHEAWAAWEDGLLRLRHAFDTGTIPACRIVLHACLWADTSLTAEGPRPLPDACEILPGRIVSRAAHNELLHRMHAAFAARFPEAVVIEIPAALRVADAAHRWGAAPFHFIPSYYEAFAREAAWQGVPLGARGADNSGRRDG